MKLQLVDSVGILRAILLIVIWAGTAYAQPKLGIFANVAASSNTDNRRFTEILSRGWSWYCTNRIAPLLEDYETELVLWHLPGGSDHEPRKPMDFDGFAEIRASLRTSPHLMPAHEQAFQGAMVDLHHRYPLKSIFYVGSLPADLSVSSLPLSKWYQRVNRELAIYKRLPIHKSRWAICFDAISYRRNPTDPDSLLVSERSREYHLLTELQDNGFGVLIEEHPFAGDSHLYRFGIVVLAHRWLSQKAMSRDYIRAHDIPVTAILTNPGNWEAISKDKAIDVVCVPYAGFRTKFKAITDLYRRGEQ